MQTVKIFYTLAAIAALALVGSIVLTALGKPQPEVLNWTVISIVSAATGGAIVQGTHLSTQQRQADITAAYQGDETKRVV